MRQISITHAKAHLSRILKEVGSGQTVIITKAGRPIAKIVAIDMAQPNTRLGFFEPRSRIPGDFDRMARNDIAELFETGDSAQETP